MSIMNINGIDTYYELHGQGEPLVLIAGYTCDHTFWGLMLDELSKHYQILIFDNRGIGQTKDDGSDFTLEMMADNTMSLIQTLGLKNPHILGQSMGGAIAQIIAKKYPDRINKLIILNSAAKFNTRTIQAIESLLNLRKENVSFDLLIEASMPWFFSSDYLSKPENISAFKEILKNNPYPQSLRDQERQFRAIPPFDSCTWTHEIKATALVIAAEEDIVALPTESKQLATSLSNAQFITISGGHSSPLEQPDEVNNMVLKFL